MSSMKMRLLLTLSSLLAIVGFGGTANALSIDCATVGCIGGSYTLDIISTGGGHVRGDLYDRYFGRIQCLGDDVERRRVQGRK